MKYVNLFQDQEFSFMCRQDKSSELHHTITCSAPTRSHSRIQVVLRPHNQCKSHMKPSIVVKMLHLRFNYLSLCLWRLSMVFQLQPCQENQILLEGQQHSSEASLFLMWLACLCWASLHLYRMLYSFVVLLSHLIFKHNYHLHNAELDSVIQ